MLKMPAISRCRVRPSPQCMRKRWFSTQRSSTSACARPFAMPMTPRTHAYDPAAGLARCQGHGDMLGNRQRRRQPGALDAEQSHQPRQPVGLGPVDGKVGYRLALTVELGSDAGVIGMQALDVEPGIVAANEIEKFGELFRLEAVVDAGRPFDVWPEFTASGDIDRGV